MNVFIFQTMHAEKARLYLEQKRLQSNTNSATSRSIGSASDTLIKKQNQQVDKEEQYGRRVQGAVL